MDNVIVVASGKGGTGKSTVCICLSVALVKKGKKVLLIDCDCGMRGLDIMLDIEQDILFDASDAVCGNCSFGEAIYKSRHNKNLYLMAAPFDAENELSPSVFRQLHRFARGHQLGLCHCLRARRPGADRHQCRADKRARRIEGEEKAGGAGRA